MSKLPVSAIVLTWNSGSTLEANLKSLSNMSEIIVVDGGSTDRTIEIAKNHGAKIIEQQNPGIPITDFSIERNAAQTHATEPWILHLDSDEMLDPNCEAEIKTAIQSQPAAYYVPRKYVLTDGRTVDYATSYPNARLYFFHREVFKAWIKPVHERIEVMPGSLVNKFKNGSLAPIGTVEEYKEKNLRYIALEKAKSKGWGHWFKNRLWHTTRSRLILLIKLILIWLIPRRGVRLPLKHELMRFWYGWKLVWSTCPLWNKTN